MHNIYPYHAKFNKIIPSHLIKKFSKMGDIVLDPFCGCGTTLLEAVKNNRNAIGIDLSPIGILCSKVKTSYYDMMKIKTYANNILESNEEQVLIPNFTKKHIWYSNEVIKLLAILNYRIKCEYGINRE